MWWIIGIVLVVAFVAWIVWELVKAPILPEFFDGRIVDEKDKEEEEDVFS